MGVGVDCFHSMFFRIFAGAQIQQCSHAQAESPSSLNPPPSPLHSRTLPVRCQGNLVAWLAVVSETIYLFPKKSPTLHVHLSSCQSFCRVVMVEINPPVTIVDLPTPPCRMQHQLFGFKLLKIYNHQPGLCLFWGIGLSALWHCRIPSSTLARGCSSFLIILSINCWMLFSSAPSEMPWMRMLLRLERASRSVSFIFNLSLACSDWLSASLKSLHSSLRGFKSLLSNHSFNYFIAIIGPLLSYTPSLLI